MLDVCINPASSIQHLASRTRSNSKPNQKIMARDLTKYLHGEMDKEAGIDHTSHRTKIVATVGPACDTYEKLLALVKAGVNVFRLNFSHGSHEDKKQIITYIREI